MTTSEQCIAGTEVLLDVLGAMKPRKIAKWFRVQGVTGRQGSANSCPIARFLAHWLPDDAVVCVGADDVFVISRSSPWGTGANLLLPPNVLKFRQRFDAGKYPRLFDSAA